MTASDAQSIASLALTLSIVGFFVVIAFYVWYALALAKLFPKLGAESWRGWIPVLNEMEILVRGGVPGWSVVYYFIPIVSLYGLYLKATAVHRINVQLGKGVGMTVLGILLPPVWASMLGWGHTAAVAGVGHKRMEAMLGADAPASAGATGPLAAQPTAFSPPPFQAAAASDASGYALPTPPAPAPPSAPPAPFAAPPVPPTSFAAPAPTPPPPPATPSTPPVGGSAMIQNPWAPQAPAAAPVAPPPTATPSAAPPAAVPHAVTPPPAPTPIAPPPAVPATDLPASTPPAAIVSTPPTIAATPVVPADPPVIPAVPEPAPQPEAEPEPAAIPDPEPAAAAPILVSTDVASDDDEDDLDRTVVVDRRPVVPWTLHTDDGFSVALTASAVVLGRNPASKEPGVEAIAIPDTTRTLSKTHARLDLVDGGWTVTDLRSTNGVIVVGADDSENLIAVDEATPLLARFVLGKVGMRVSFEEEPAS